MFYKKIVCSINKQFLFAVKLAWKELYVCGETKASETM